MHWTGSPNARWHGIPHGRHRGSCSTALANKTTPVLCQQLGTGGICTLRFTPDPGRTRTYNPRLRGPMPYPLGHGATCKSLELCPDNTLLLTRKELVAELPT